MSSKQDYNRKYYLEHIVPKRNAAKALLPKGEKPVKSKTVRIRTYGDAVCSYCARLFKRAKHDIKASERLKRQSFCSSECQKAGKNNKDYLSPFRVCLHQIKARQTMRGIELDITAEDLYAQWNAQGGKCPYTGWDLDISYLSIGKGTKGLNTNAQQPSVDRTDPSKGYVKGNVEFVSLMFNYAKNKFSVSDVVRFCHSVVNNMSSK